MNYNQQAQQQLQQFINQHQQRINNAKFTDDELQKYWEAIKHDTQHELNKLQQATDNLNSINRKNQLRMIQLGIERFNWIMHCAKNDEFVTAQWLPRAPKRVIHYIHHAHNIKTKNNTMFTNQQ